LHNPWVGALNVDLFFSLLSMGGVHRADLATFQICRIGYLFYLFISTSFTLSCWTKVFKSFWKRFFFVANFATHIYRTICFWFLRIQSIQSPRHCTCTNNCLAAVIPRNHGWHVVLVVHLGWLSSQYLAKQAVIKI
jgi:hypothetical protein